MAENSSRPKEFLCTCKEKHWWKLLWHSGINFFEGILLLLLLLLRFIYTYIQPTQHTFHLRLNFLLVTEESRLLSETTLLVSGQNREIKSIELGDLHYWTMDNFLGTSLIYGPFEFNFVFELNSRLDVSEVLGGDRRKSWFRPEFLFESWALTTIYCLQLPRCISFVRVVVLENENLHKLFLNAEKKIWKNSKRILTYICINFWRWSVNLMFENYIYINTTYFTNVYYNSVTYTRVVELYDTWVDEWVALSFISRKVAETTVHSTST